MIVDLLLLLPPCVNVWKELCAIRWLRQWSTAWIHCNLHTGQKWGSRIQLWHLLIWSQVTQTLLTLLFGSCSWIFLLRSILFSPIYYSNDFLTCRQIQAWCCVVDPSCSIGHSVSVLEVVVFQRISPEHWSSPGMLLSPVLFSTDIHEIRCNNAILILVNFSDVMALIARLIHGLSLSILCTLTTFSLGLAIVF